MKQPKAIFSSLDKICQDKIKTIMRYLDEGRLSEIEKLYECLVGKINKKLDNLKSMFGM